VGSRASMDGCGNSASDRDSIPGPSSPQRVAVSTALSRPHQKTVSSIHTISQENNLRLNFSICVIGLTESVN
jgi:hypothetical protein